MADKILGLKAFEILSAEHEKWLQTAFVPPRDFQLLTENHSFLIIGGGGTGKTAVRLAIEKEITGKNKKDNNLERTKTLLVNWIPDPLEDDQSGSLLMRFALNQIIHACIKTLLSTYSNEPERFETTPQWSQDAIAWLLYNYLPGDPNFYIESREHEFGKNTIKWALDILKRPYREILPKSAATTETIQLLLITLESLGYINLWVVVDGLEKWSALYHVQAERTLEAILSTLSLFEQRGFVFKFFIPDFMQSTLVKTSSIDRRRVQFYPLLWSESEIKNIIEKRLYLATGKSPFSLEKLCSDLEFTNWLLRYGGTNPRIWLSLLAPFVETYLRTGKSLSEKTWNQIARQYPPKLRVDLFTRKVFIGDYELIHLSPNERRILEYLYVNRHRICSREEIYYRCILNLEQEPKQGETTRVDETIWRGPLDQALSRLRKMTEPDKNPLYVKTQKGYGIRLENYQ